MDLTKGLKSMKVILVTGLVISVGLILMYSYNRPEDVVFVLIVGWSVNCGFLLLGQFIALKEIGYDIETGEEFGKTLQSMLKSLNTGDNREHSTFVFEHVVARMREDASRYSSFWDSVPISVRAQLGEFIREKMNAERAEHDAIQNPSAQDYMRTGAQIAQLEKLLESVLTKEWIVREVSPAKEIPIP